MRPPTRVDDLLVGGGEGLALLDLLLETTDLVVRWLATRNRSGRALTVSDSSASMVNSCGLEHAPGIRRGEGRLALFCTVLNVIFMVGCAVEVTRERTADGLWLREIYDTRQPTKPTSIITDTSVSVRASGQSTGAISVDLPSQRCNKEST